MRSHLTAAFDGLMRFFVTRAAILELTAWLHQVANMALAVVSFVLDRAEVTRRQSRDWRKQRDG